MRNKDLYMHALIERCILILNPSVYQPSRIYSPYFSRIQSVQLIIRTLQVVNPAKALTCKIEVGNPIFLSLLSFPNSNFSIEQVIAIMAYSLCLQPREFNHNEESNDISGLTHHKFKNPLQ